METICEILSEEFQFVGHLFLTVSRHITVHNTPLIVMFYLVKSGCYRQKKSSAFDLMQTIFIPVKLQLNFKYCEDCLSLSKGPQQAFQPLLHPFIFLMVITTKWQHRIIIYLCKLPLILPFLFFVLLIWKLILPLIPLFCEIWRLQFSEGRWKNQQQGDS